MAKVINKVVSMLNCQMLPRYKARKFLYQEAGIAQWVQRWATGWTAEELRFDSR
jgi:hypothetical protein